MELDMKVPMGLSVCFKMHTPALPPSRTQTLLTLVTGSSAPVPLAGSEKTPQVSRDVVPCMAWAEGNEAGMRVHRACG